MKCGYCGNDFAESQHHYCPEGQRFLLAELARLRAVNAELKETVRTLQTEYVRQQPFADPQDEIDELERETARLRAANAELSVTIQKLRKALTYYAEQEYNPSRADDGVIAREALR